MDKAYELTINANDGKMFNYIVDPSGMLTNYSSISTDVNIKPIVGNIKIITKKIIEKMVYDEKEVIELDGKTWNYEKMFGKYFDEEGRIYYNIDNRLYPFIYTSKYLVKYYNEL